MPFFAALDALDIAMNYCIGTTPSLIGLLPNQRRQPFLRRLLAEALRTMIQPASPSCSTAGHRRAPAAGHEARRSPARFTMLASCLGESAGTPGLRNQRAGGYRPQQWSDSSALLKPSGAPVQFCVPRTLASPSVLPNWTGWIRV